MTVFYLVQGDRCIIDIEDTIILFLKPNIPPELSFNIIMPNLSDISRFPSLFPTDGRDELNKSKCFASPIPDFSIKNHSPMCNPSTSKYPATVEAWEGNGNGDPNQDIKYYDFMKEMNPEIQESLKENSPIHRAKRPNLSWSQLIINAFKSAQKENLLVSEIYDEICRIEPYFKIQKKINWKNAVRHTLSMNSCFYRLNDHEYKNGYWSYQDTIIPSLSSASHRNIESFFPTNLRLKGSKEKRIDKISDCKFTHTKTSEDSYSLSSSSLSSSVFTSITNSSSSTVTSSSLSAPISRYPPVLMNQSKSPIKPNNTLHPSLPLIPKTSSFSSTSSLSPSPIATHTSINSTNSVSSTLTHRPLLPALPKFVSNLTPPFCTFGNLLLPRDPTGFFRSL